MTILWCGGEDVDFNYDSPSYVGVDPFSGRSNYSRGGVYGNGGYLYTNTFQSATSLWFHAYLEISSGVAYDGDYVVLKLYEDDKNGIFLRINPHSSHQYIKLSQYDGSWHDLSTSAFNSLLTTTSEFDFNISIADYGASATIKVYVGATEVINYSGSVLTYGEATSINRLAIGNWYHAVYSEIIVSTTDTRLMSLKTLIPNAAGDTNDWTGAYTDIDEDEISADVIYTTGVGDDFQCNLTGMPSGVYKIKSVKTVVKAADEAQTMGLKVGVKTNSAVHLGGSVSLGGSWAVIEKLYQNNPETASAFTSGEIDALQLAIRTDSTTTTTTSTTT